MRTLARRNLQFLVACFVAAMPLETAAQDCLLSGEVHAGGQPLAGVELSVRIASGAFRPLGSSGSDGRFAIAVAPLEPDEQRLAVKFAKSGFQDITRLLKPNSGNRCPLLPSGKTVLDQDPDSPIGANIHSRTLYIAPFELYHDGGEEDAAHLNRIFDRVLHHRIRAFVTRLQLEDPPEEISVVKLEQAISMADGESVRSLGSDLRALGIIGGEGEARQNADGEKVIDLWSEFRVIPYHRHYREHRVQIGDTIPSGRVSPLRISHQLKDFWGQKAVIALAVRELSDSDNPPSRQRKLQIQNRLNAVRKTMEESDALLPEVQRLMDVIAGDLEQ